MRRTQNDNTSKRIGYDLNIKRLRAQRGAGNIDLKEIDSGQVHCEDVYHL